MARLRDITFDCRYPAALARFWAAVLDGYDVAPYGEAELARLRAEGVDDPENDPTVLVEAPGVRPRLWFQRVPEGKVVKNRVHLDVVADDRGREVDRLLGLGAARVADRGEWTVMTDPKGTSFACSNRAAGRHWRGPGRDVGRDGRPRRQRALRPQPALG